MRVATVDQARELARLRAGIIGALEAIEDGDTGYALAILRALDDGPAEAKSIRCPRCTLRFTWPGELDHHLRFSHDAELPAELERAA